VVGVGVVLGWPIVYRCGQRNTRCLSRKKELAIPTRRKGPPPPPSSRKPKGNKKHFCVAWWRVRLLRPRRDNDGSNGCSGRWLQGTCTVSVLLLLLLRIMVTFTTIVGARSTPGEECAQHAKRRWWRPRKKWATVVWPLLDLWKLSNHHFSLGEHGAFFVFVVGSPSLLRVVWDLASSPSRIYRARAGVAVSGMYTRVEYDLAATITRVVVAHVGSGDEDTRCPLRCGPGLPPSRDEGRWLPTTTARRESSSSSPPPPRNKRRRLRPDGYDCPHRSHRGAGKVCWGSTSPVGEEGGGEWWWWW